MSDMQITQSSKKQLRYYQEEAIEAILNDWAHGVRALIGMCTGSGKTFTFVALLNLIWSVITNQAEKKRALIIVHQDSLIHQAHATFGADFEYDVTLGRVQADTYDEYDADIVFAMVQSLTPKRIKKLLSHGLFDYVIIDESHHYVENAWGKSLQSVLKKCPEAKVLGCTATWNRADGTSLGVIFPQVAERDQLTYYYPIEKAIGDGYLARFNTYAVEVQMDGKQLSYSNGYYGTEAEWDALWNAGNWADLLYDMWVAKGGLSKQTMCFAPSVHISKEFCEWLGQEKGIISVHVDGEGSWIYDHNQSKMVPEHREVVVKLFRERKIGYLSNFGIFTEGTDFPHLEILLMMRPVTSPVLFIQMFGRALRKPEDLPDKVAEIFLIGFEDKNPRLAGVNSIMGGLPDKNKKKLERALKEIGSGIAAYAPVCNACQQGKLEHQPDSMLLVCDHCGGTALIEEQEGLQLFDPSKPSGMSAVARLINLLAEQSVKWLAEDGLYSVGLGVGSDHSQGDAKANRVLFIVPPSRSPMMPDKWCVIVIAYPVTGLEQVPASNRFTKSYAKHTFGPPEGRLIPAINKDYAFKLADDLASRLADPMLSDKDKKWNKEPASNDQKKYMKGLNVPPEKMINGIRKGRAGQLISHYKSLKHLRQKGILYA